MTEKNQRVLVCVFKAMGSDTEFWFAWVERERVFTDSGELIPELLVEVAPETVVSASWFGCGQRSADGMDTHAYLVHHNERLPAEEAGWQKGDFAFVIEGQ